MDHPAGSPWGAEGAPDQRPCGDHYYLLANNANIGG